MVLRYELEEKSIHEVLPNGSTTFFESEKQKKKKVYPGVSDDNKAQGQVDRSKRKEKSLGNIKVHRLFLFSDSYLKTTGSC